MPFKVSIRRTVYHLLFDSCFCSRDSQGRIILDRLPPLISIPTRRAHHRRMGRCGHQPRRALNLDRPQERYVHPTSSIHDRRDQAPKPLLRADPRVKIGIPVIGCPDYLALLASRAEHAGVTLTPPYVPASLLSIIRREDPAAVSIRASEASANPFLGKKILVLSGAADKLVPWAASKEFVEALHVGEGGRKQVVLEEGAGHEYTDRMKAELVKFFWEEALVTDPKPAL